MSTSISAPTGFFNGSAGNSQAAQDLQSAITAADTSIPASVAAAAASENAATISASAASTSATAAAASASAASGAVATVLASPPTIGGTTPGIGKFTDLVATVLTNGVAGGSGAATFYGPYSGANTALSVFAPFGAISGALNPVFSVNASVGGSATSSGWSGAINGILIGGDTLAVGGSIAAAVGFGVTHVVGGTGMTGGRIAVSSALKHSATSSNTSTQYYIGHGASADSYANEGGTSGATRGNLFGRSVSSTLNTGATHWASVTGDEIDVAILPGASADYKIGLQIVELNTSAVQSTLDSWALAINTQAGGAPPGFAIGITFGSPFGWWPIPTTGTLIGTRAAAPANPGPAYTAAYGVKIDAVTFSQAAWMSNGAKIDGSGNGTLASLIIGTAGPTITGGAAAPSSIQPASSIYMRSGGASGARVYVSAGGGTWNAISGV